MELFFFILGAAIGSFLGVLSERLPEGREVIFGRSQCDWCHQPLRWFELVPTASWVFQKGRCRRCHKKLSPVYPILEIATGIIFVTLYASFGFNLVLLPQLVLSSALLVIFLSDIKYQIIPDSMTIISLVAILWLKYLSLSPIIKVDLWVTFGVASFFLLLWLATHGRGMGFGDVKLAPVLAFWLGWPLALVALYIAFLTGAIVAVILMISRVKSLKSRIAFGPFLVFGSVIAAWQSELLLSWWQKWL